MRSHYMFLNVSKTGDGQVKLDEAPRCIPWRRTLLQKPESGFNFFVSKHTVIDITTRMKPFLCLNCYTSRTLLSRLSLQTIRKRIASFQQLRRYATNELDDEMGKEKEKSNFQLKVPKGTKDWQGTDMVIRDKIFGTITEVFKRHGAVTIDTLVNLPIPHVEAFLVNICQTSI